MNATRIGIFYCMWAWAANAPKVVIELDEYRRLKWLRHFTRPMTGDAA